MKEALAIISVMFMSREQAHREHLKTTSYAQHMALGEFYDEIVDIADEFAETYQGFYEDHADIPYRMPTKGPIISILENHLGVIQDARKALDSEDDTPLQNIIDTACALYARTLYKLRRLK